MRSITSRHNSRVAVLIVWAQIIAQLFLPLYAAQPDRVSQPYVENTPEILPNSGMLNSVATTLSNNHSDGIKNSAKSLAAGKAASTAEEWLNQFGTARVNISVDNHGKWDDSSLDLFTPLYDNNNSVWFTQFGLRAPDNRVTGNVGTGVRTYSFQNWMFGGNVFFDNDFTGKNRRVGLGGEAWTNFLKLSANAYAGTTHWHNSRDFDNYDEKPADGFDIRAEGYLPAYPQLGAKLMYEQYYGDKVALFNKDTLQHNPSAITTGLSYTPVPLIALAADYRQGQDSKSEAKFQINVRYDIGQNWRAQLSPDNVQALRTLEGSRYDLVERNNQIILQYKKKPDHGVSNLVLRTVTDNAPADGLTENTLQVLATNRDNEPVRNAAITWATTGAARFVSRMAVTNNEGIATATLTNTRPEVVQVSVGSGSIITLLPSRFSNVVVTHVVLKLTNDNSVADGKTANTAVATITDINNRPIPNSKVSWAATAPSTLVNPQLITDSNGQARAQLTSTTAGAFVMTVGAGELTARQTTRFVANNADAHITDFVSTTNNSPANGSTPNVAQLTVKDRNGNPVSDVSVDISADKSTVSFAGATARSVAMQTDSHGQLRVAFSDTIAEAVTLTAKLANGSTKTVKTTFSADSTTAQINHISITKNSSAANGALPNTAEALVTDANGNPVSGVAVLWRADKSTVQFASSSNTDAAGKTTVNFTDTVAETLTITASLSNGSRKTASAQFIPDSASAQLQNLLVTKDGSAANGTAANRAEVYVVDGTGNPVSGQVVNWSANKAGVNFTPGGVTDVAGKATVSYTSTVAQSFQLNAALSNGKTVSTTSLFVADTASERIAALDVTTGAIADGSATNTASVRVTDASNNPLANVPVTWSTNGSAILSASAGTTDANGRMTVTITDLKAETVNVTASLSTGAHQTSAVQFIGNASTAQIHAFTVTTGALANGSEQNEIEAKVTDAQGNALAGQVVSWTASSPDVSLPASSSTDTAGISRVMLTSSEAGTFTITLRLNNGVTQTIASTFTPVPVILPTNLTMNFDNAVADGVAQNNILAVVTDKNNNPLAGQTVHFSATNGANITAVIAVTKADGIATAIAKSTTAGPSTVTASLDSGSTASVVMHFQAPP